MCRDLQNMWSSTQLERSEGCSVSRQSTLEMCCNGAMCLSCCHGPLNQFISHLYIIVTTLFLPWTVESSPFTFWRWRNKLKWAPFELLLPPHYCGLGAGSIPFRAIANNKQCEMRGLFMSLVIHYWIGDVQDCQGVSASEMTYIVSGGA